jgi:hypothetical protein
MTERHQLGPEPTLSGDVRMALEADMTAFSDQLDEHAIRLNELELADSAVIMNAHELQLGELEERAAALELYHTAVAEGLAERVAALERLVADIGLRQEFIGYEDVVPDAPAPRD